MKRFRAAWGPTWATGFLALGGIALLSCSAVRADRLSMTHDEALSFLMVSSFPWSNVLTLNYPAGLRANGHLPVSLYIKALGPEPVPSEIALRLPSLFAHALYLLASILISRRFPSFVSQVACFVLLAVNPFLTDFFGLARGYSFAMAFLLLGIYFLMRCAAAEEGSVRFGTAAVAFAGLSALSNLPLINFLLAILLAVVGREFIAARKSCGNALSTRAFRLTLRRVWPALAISAGLMAYLVPTLLSLRASGNLYYGDQTGFLRNTLLGSVKALLYGRHYGKVLTVGCAALAVAIAVAGLVLAAVGRRGKAGAAAREGSAVLAVLWFAALASLAEHAVFGTPYPTGRTALGLMIVLLLVISQTFVALPRFVPLRVAQALHGTLAALALAHGVYCFNLTASFTWRTDADVKPAMALLCSYHSHDMATDEPATLGIPWEYEPAVNYYRLRFGMFWMPPASRQGLAGDYDFIYCNKEDLRLARPATAVLIGEFKNTDTVLLRRLRGGPTPR